MACVKMRNIQLKGNYFWNSLEMASGRYFFINVAQRGCAYEICYDTDLEELEKIKENLNITSMNEITLRSVLIEIR